MPMPDGTLRALFGMEPEAAVGWLRSKGMRITWSWAEMLDQAHARAFTMAKGMRMDILQDVRGGLLDALKEGKTLRQFSDDLTPLLQKKGWWGKQVIVDSQGNAEMVQLGSPRRLKTIYQTNMQSAYMAGRAQAQQEADAFPYLQYVAVMDAATRHSHAALNGQVFRKDDPVWASITPPNGFNCRCRTRALSAGQLQREGLTVQSSEGRLLTREVDAGLNKRTGELFKTTQTGIRTTGPDGKPTVMWTDPGFNSSPLAGHWMDKHLAQKAVSALGDEAGFAMVQKAVLSPTRLKAWEGFVANTLDFARTQGQTMTVGILPYWLARKAVIEEPVLYVPDRLIVGKKSQRHIQSGDSLAHSEWSGLPQLIQHVDQWYIDTHSKNIVAVKRQGDQVVKIVIAPNGQIDTIHKAISDDIEGAIRGGQLKVIQQ
ncbi:MAG: phage minor head protein [Porticoccaceae bacterium]|nr:phage minor head protein [Porticoccaceae bacterium]